MSDIIYSIKDIPKNKFINRNLDKLDSFQSSAVLSEAEKIVIKAPAGSGKTGTCIAAIANYRYEHAIDRICAITYTRAARAEMEVRLQELGIYDVEVTTIHVWSRNLLHEFAAKYNFKIEILEEAKIKYILTNLVNEYLQKSKVKSVNINILYNYITGNKNMDVSDSYKQTLKALDTRYINFKRENGLYDFTDYPLYLYNILITYNETIDNVDALFVDEFQDVDEIQFNIFELVNAKKKFYIGDSWQSIFQFRSADGMVFEKLPDFEVYKLKRNYRSYQEIIDYATTVYMTLLEQIDYQDVFISMIMTSEPSSIDCQRGYGGEVIVINPYGRGIKFHNDISQKINVHESFKEMINNKPMILCRTNKQVKAIQDFGYGEVSTVHQAKGLEYDNVIVIDHNIDDKEDLNVAYVAMTRAKNKLFIINWPQFELLFKLYAVKEDNLC